MLLKDDVNRPQYGVKIDGQIVYKNSQLSNVENYKEGLSESQKAKAQVVPLTEGNREILFG